MSSQQLTSTRVNEAIERLSEEFSGRFSPETIRDLVTASLEPYRESRITDFVPLLVYRSARDRLGALARGGAPLRRPDPRSR